MAENSASDGEPPTETVANDNQIEEDTEKKPLKMSFVDWKKSKDMKGKSQGGARNGRKQQKNDNKCQSNNRNNNNNNNKINNNIGFPPLSRPPPLPFPLINMGYGNFGPGPGPRGPMMGPGMGNSNMGSPGLNKRNHRPLQPPPFWADMMSPHNCAPPIQPPMPKCPSLWNLVPKDKQQQSKKQQQQHSQPNKKCKPNNSNNNNTNNKNNATADAALMPPPPAPGGTGAAGGATPSDGNKTNGLPKKKKGGFTYVQIDGRWIPRPEAPPPLEDAPPGTKEDRQRQWREYRQAMKPFKNREFHNWKRTVQRLSKLPRDQLDERSLERLQKAEEYIGAHKAMLTIKHAEQWVQQNNQKPDGADNGQAGGSSSVPGQVYVRKQWEKKEHHSHPFQRKQIFGTGRAIKGGLGGVADLSIMPPLPPTAPPTTPMPGQFPAEVSGGFYGSTQGFSSSSSLFGIGVQDTPVSAGNSSAGNAGISTSSNSNPFYTNYNSSFVKGGTLLPP